MQNAEPGPDKYPKSLTRYFIFTHVFVTPCQRMGLPKAGVPRQMQVDTAACLFIGAAIESFPYLSKGTDRPWSSAYH